MNCTKCNASSGSLYISEYIDYLKETIYKCRLCGQEQAIADISKPKQQTSTPKQIDMNGVLRPEKESGQPKRTNYKHHTKRYRKSALFKVTNRRVQRRYRQTPKGQQVIKDQNRRMSILEKLEAWSRGDLFILDSSWKELNENYNGKRKRS